MASSKLSLKFRIFKGNELVGFRELNQTVIKIGKVPSAHLHIDDDSISRMHAIVEVTGTTAHIIDLGSTRGTYVNGTKVNKARLADGDAIQLGDLRLELALVDLTAPAEAPTMAVAVPPPVPVAAATTAPRAATTSAAATAAPRAATTSAAATAAPRAASTSAATPGSKTSAAAPMAAGMTAPMTAAKTAPTASNAAAMPAQLAVKSAPAPANASTMTFAAMPATTATTATTGTPRAVGAAMPATTATTATSAAQRAMGTASFLTAPASPQALAAATADDEPGARAVEVATMLGDSVVDVKHCMDPRGGKVTAKTWGFVAGGVACLLASATAFYVSVDTAAQNRASLAYHTEVLKKPAYSHRPRQLGVGVDWVAFGGLGLGLLALTAGLARARGERKSPYYRIGTAPGVEQPVEHAPAPDFPMVAPSGDEFVFNYGAGMDGEMIVDGKATPLAELVGAGLARPSAATAGTIEVPIPPRAKIRARAGQTTFLVSAVNKPRQHAAPLFALERRTAAYVAGSLALHVGIVAFLQTIPPDDAGANINLSSLEDVTIKGSISATEDVPPEREENTSDGGGGEETAGARMALEEGAAGKPDSPNDNGKMEIKDRGEKKELSREQAIEQARNAGVLGSVQHISGGISAITGTADWSSGIDQADFYGPLFGGQGEGRGNFGMGVYGMGRGGGCYGSNCGLLGTGRYATIGNGDKAGDGWGPGGPGKGGWRKRDPRGPIVDISRPIPTDGLDREIIKRYVKRNLAKISYCYESELLAKSDLAGTVTVQFLIAANGGVTSSIGSGMDTSVANCVAAVVKNIQFPKPTNGGVVQVNYPFTFRAAGR